MSKGKWKEEKKIGCKLCNGTGAIEDNSYPNILFAGCVPMFSKVCPRCGLLYIRETECFCPNRELKALEEGLKEDTENEDGEKHE